MAYFYFKWTKNRGAAQLTPVEELTLPAAVPLLQRCHVTSKATAPSAQCLQRKCSAFITNRSLKIATSLMPAVGVEPTWG